MHALPQLRTPARRAAPGPPPATSAPSGSSATAATDGPASNRWAVGCRQRSAKQRRTPTGSLSRSQRETWTTSGTCSGIGASWSSSAARSTRPWVPSWRRNTAADPPPAARPDRARIALTASGPISWFLAEKASIEGGTTHSFRLVEALPGEGSTREDVGVGRLDVAGAGSPRRRGRARSGCRARRDSARRRVRQPTAAPASARPSGDRAGRRCPCRRVAGSAPRRWRRGFARRPPFPPRRARRRRRRCRAGGCGSAW